MLNSWCVSIRIYWLVFCQITLWLFVLQHVDSFSLLRVWSRERNRVTARSDQPGFVCHTALTCKSLSLWRSYCVIYWCSGFIDYLCQVGAVCFTLCPSAVWFGTWSPDWGGDAGDCKVVMKQVLDGLYEQKFIHYFHISANHRKIILKRLWQSRTSRSRAVVETFGAQLHSERLQSDFYSFNTLNYLFPFLAWMINSAWWWAVTSDIVQGQI